MCNGCSSSDLKLGGVKCLEEFTRGNVELKDTLEKAKYVKQSQNSSATALKAKYSDLSKWGNQYALELRFSGIPQKKSNAKKNF